jgi:hypothetical protein
MEAYENVKRQQAQRLLEREVKMKHLDFMEQQQLIARCALNIQRVYRGFFGRKTAIAAAKERDYKLKTKVGMLKV